MAKTEYFGNGPNHPTKVFQMPAYALGRGKCPPPALPNWGSYADGMGRKFDQDAIAAGTKILNEALK